MKVENIIGKPVQGQNFFGRGAELDDLADITQREHVLMLAPRRVGKTSLLHALAGRVDDEGSAIGVYASVAAATTEAEFVQAVLQAIYATAHGRKLKRGFIARTLGLGRRVKSVKLASAAMDLETRAHPWQEDADQAFAAVMTSERPLLILIDELPLLVLALARSDPSIGRVRIFLQWFRNLRQHLDGATQLRFVLAGSIGLDNVTRRHQLTDTINDLRVWPLGPFDEASAQAFLAALASSYRLDLGRELISEICRAAEWLIPYHLQVIFSVLREHAHETPLSAALLANTVESLLDRRTYFSYWDERLHDALGEPSASHARTVLTMCAQTAEGAARGALDLAMASLLADPTERARQLRWIGDVLMNDGYLAELDGRWRFRSGLLRRYWLRHVA